MKLLEERIRKDGTVKAGNVLKVDSFLNHQMDIDLFNEMGKEWARLFADRKITKILTVEASGIGIACLVAQYFHVPVVFAKKAQSLNLDGEIPQNGVIRCLLLYLDLPQLPVGVLSGSAQHFDEQLLGGKVGAAGSGQIPAPGQQLHGAVVDLLVAAHGVLHRAARLGKGRGIQNDKVV